MTRVFIDGAEGTTGLEIRTRLADAADIETIDLPADRRKDERARSEALNAADIAILCLPDAAARQAAALLAPHARTRIIDASTAHRTAPGWTYGFPELVGPRRVADAPRVANPGCYPTGFLALVAPLVRAGLLPADWPYTVHAVSGYSGGGKGLIARFEEDRAIAWRGYALGLGHKHLDEMQAHAGLAYPPVFSPAVVDAHRGMVVEVPLPLAAMAALGTRPAPADALRAALADAYAGSAVVTVVPELAPGAPETGELLLRRDVAGWDGMELAVFAGADGGQARLVARLDNLGKGASGAAVQALNLMTGRPETAGLRL